jgi:hypothetical protein
VFEAILGAGVSVAPGAKVETAGVQSLGNIHPTVEPVVEPHPSITTPYERPSGATTAEQRASVQGKPCVECGKVGPKMVANHKKALVEEYYQTGKIDKMKMRATGSVNSHCPTCSAKSGGRLSHYSKQMKAKLKAN